MHSTECPHSMQVPHCSLDDCKIFCLCLAMDLQIHPSKINTRIFFFDCKAKIQEKSICNSKKEYLNELPILIPLMQFQPFDWPA